MINGVVSGIRFINDENIESNVNSYIIVRVWKLLGLLDDLIEVQVVFRWRLI